MRQAEHAYALCVSKQRALSGGGIDADRESGYDKTAAFCYLIPHFAAHFDAVRRGIARTDNSNCSLLVDGREHTLYIQHRGWGKYILQP